MGLNMGDSKPYQLKFREELKIPVPWGYLAAKAWGPVEGTPVLALHGWQDNASTYDTLAPLLPATLNLVCLDFCGYGLSSHYPPGMFLNYYDHVHHVKLVLNYFRWKKVILMGHSMGGVVTLLFTSMFPELVDKLINLDVIGQFSLPSKELPLRLRKYLTAYQRTLAKLEKGPSSPITYAEAKDRLVQGYFGSIDEKAAEILLSRGLEKVGEEDAWVFRRDLRTTIRPFLFNELTNQQIKAVARGITCPLLVITTNSDPSEVYGEMYDIYRDSSEDFRLFEIEGRHHIHLTNAELVAPHIYNFLCPLQSKL